MYFVELCLHFPRSVYPASLFQKNSGIGSGRYFNGQKQLQDHQYLSIQQSVEGCITLLCKGLRYVDNALSFQDRGKKLGKGQSESEGGMKRNVFDPTPWEEAVHFDVIYVSSQSI